MYAFEERLFRLFRKEAIEFLLERKAYIVQRAGGWRGRLGIAVRLRLITTGSMIFAVHPYHYEQYVVVKVEKAGGRNLARRLTHLPEIMYLIGFDVKFRRRNRGLLLIKRSLASHVIGFKLGG